MKHKGESWEEHNARLEAVPEEDLEYDVQVLNDNAANHGAPTG